jgi:hypothetical protein
MASSKINRSGRIANILIRTNNAMRKKAKEENEKQ